MLGLHFKGLTHYLYKNDTSGSVKYRIIDSFNALSVTSWRLTSSRCCKEHKAHDLNMECTKLKIYFPILYGPSDRLPAK